MRMTELTGKTRRKSKWNQRKENCKKDTPSFSRCLARLAETVLSELSNHGHLRLPSTRMQSS